MDDGRRVNPRKAQGWQCPICGQMLEWLMRQDRKGNWVRYSQTIRSRKRLGPDDVCVDRVRKVSKWEEKVVGKEWVHTVELLCPTCGAMSKGQAKQHHFDDSELPSDYYEGKPMSSEDLATMTEMLKSGASFAEVAEWLREANGCTAQKPSSEPKQDSLWQ